MKLEKFMTAIFEEASKFGMENWEVEKLSFEYPSEGKTVLTVKITDGKDICFVDATYQAKKSGNHSRIEMISLNFYEA